MDRAVSEIISSCWVNFAATGNPNGPGLPAWPAYSEKGEQVMIMADPVEAKSNPRAAGLAFVDAANERQTATI